MSTSELRCEYCEKRFTAAPALKRHLYYCRDRVRNPAPPRRRACKSCVAAKVRCDIRYPTCGRCQQRNVQCEYAGTQSALPGSQREAKTTPPTPPSTSIHNDHAPKTHTSISTHDPIQRKQVPGSTTAFSRRTYPPTTSTAIPDLLLTMLTTLLHTFRTTGTLPPLIHHTQHPFSPDSPLKTCHGLLTQFYTTHTETPTQLWTQLQQHCEILWFRTETPLTQPSLLACMQCLLLYTLHRATYPHPPPSPRDFDLVFLVCFNQIAGAYRKFEDEITGVVVRDPASLRWEDWVLYEGCKRMATLMRLVDLVVDISDAVPCVADPGFKVAPLPCGEAMWEARSEEEWRRVMREVKGGRMSFGVTQKGELDVVRGQGMVVEQEVERWGWADWCVGRGEIGFLVATAATLLRSAK